MTKNDLKLIHSCIATGAPKFELDFALVSDDGFYATDTKRAIHFNVPMLGCEGALLHKKLLNGFTSLMSKDDSATIGADGFLHCGLVQMDCNTIDFQDYKFPDVKRIVNQTLEYGFTLNDISDLQFELSQKDCFIDSSLLSPIIEYSDCSSYAVSFNKQKTEGDTTSTGIVKIIGLYNTEEISGLTLFTAVIIGREFKEKAKEQLLFDI